MPLQPDALYWMLDQRVIDRQWDGLNDQQQLSQCAACLTKNQTVIDFHMHTKACVDMLPHEAECKYQ